MGSKIKVMISSRCTDPILFKDNEATLSDVRKELKKKIEAKKLLGRSLFEVWINEDAPPEEGSKDSWDICMNQVKDADIVIILYNGNAGWTAHPGGIGICHGEMQKALNTAPAKTFLIQLDPLQRLRNNEFQKVDERFRKYVNEQSRFRGGETASNGETLITIFEETLNKAVINMVKLGVREAKKGNFHTGNALEWSRLNYERRSKIMIGTIQDNLLSYPNSYKQHTEIFVPIHNDSVSHFSVNAIPDSLSIASAREMMGKPYIKDYLHADLINDSYSGPIHIIACHKNITELQAIKIVGHSDVICVSAPFGIYLVDDVHKIQLIFIKDCRDETTTRNGVQRFFDWLQQTEESILLHQRGIARGRIVKTISEEFNQNPE